ARLSGLGSWTPTSSNPSCSVRCRCQTLRLRMPLPETATRRSDTGGRLAGLAKFEIHGAVLHELRAGLEVARAAEAQQAAVEVRPGRAGVEALLDPLVLLARVLAGPQLPGELQQALVQRLRAVAALEEAALVARLAVELLVEEHVASLAVHVGGQVQGAARLQHPPHLGHRGGVAVARHVLDHRDAGHVVEALAGERERG